MCKSSLSSLWFMKGPASLALMRWQPCLLTHAVANPSALIVGETVQCTSRLHLQRVAALKEMRIDLDLPSTIFIGTETDFKRDPSYFSYFSCYIHIYLDPPQTQEDTIKRQRVLHRTSIHTLSVRSTLSNQAPTVPVSSWPISQGWALFIDHCA